MLHASYEILRLTNIRCKKFAFMKIHIELLVLSNAKISIFR